MDFYKEWEECLEHNCNDDYYINSFLYRSNYSIDSLERSSAKDIKRIINFLISLDKKRIIEKIGIEHIKKINSSDVVQFSNFDKSTSEIAHILKYERDGLTFEELGYLLNSSNGKLAATKYGENQSKTAKIFNLVSFSITKPTEVKNTSLGDVFPLLNKDTQTKLLSILCLRDPVVMCLIAKAKKTNVNYDEVVCCLSESTSNRRKSNIKYLLDLALYDIDDNFIHNIKV